MAMQELASSNKLISADSAFRWKLLGTLAENLTPAEIYARWTEDAVTRRKDKKFMLCKSFIISLNVDFEEMWKHQASISSNNKPEPETEIIVLSLEVQEGKRPLLESLKLFLSISNSIHGSFYLSGLITRGLGGYRAVVRTDYAWTCLWHESTSHVRTWEYLVRWMVKGGHVPVMLFYLRKSSSEARELKLSIESASALYEFAKAREDLKGKSEAKIEKNKPIEENKKSSKVIKKKTEEDIGDMDLTPKVQEVKLVKTEKLVKAVKSREEVKETASKETVAKSPKVCPLCFVSNPAMFEGRCCVCLFLLK
eukprot:TRINITY_DN10699_c0_g2_i1.p1 TRINITY_DN10699_c0_g2~~TRINITY_DN10699_c0_g2_i1.p1  ORF type:complete len:310 (+),score=95.71 TRINITY_DN10699_c0_g2_i1:291-1220(+)